MNTRTIKTIAATIAAAGALSLAGVATGDSAHAAVVSYDTGAAADTVGACANGRLAVNIANAGFDYVIFYVYNGWTGQGTWGNQWVALANGERTTTDPVAAGSATAVYAYYADWTGAEWVTAGEWIVFGNSYYCMG
jgi:hypothetical protein